MNTSTKDDIPFAKVNPAFLHANAQIHQWAFGAFGELIDNAYDPDVQATHFYINKRKIREKQCLTFQDNGAGMDTDKLTKMLSFGFCEKSKQPNPYKPIGHYGNGFKTGSMRLAKDALVFTQCQTSASIGFLSQTYLKTIGSDCVLSPIVTYQIPRLELTDRQGSKKSLDAIINHSIFRTEKALINELKTLAQDSKTGTRIILYNLNQLKNGLYELDFVSDPTDIRCPEMHEDDTRSLSSRPIKKTGSEYKYSLKEYCSILFCKPRMIIIIRDKNVTNKYITRNLLKRGTDKYKPLWAKNPIKITFGFRGIRSKPGNCGIMLYHHNRLIKAFVRVGYQKQHNGLGDDVLGVAEVDELQPLQNKQDFINEDGKYNSLIHAFGTKLNEYWDEKKGNSNTGNRDSYSQDESQMTWTWAQCDQCQKWRRLPGHFESDLPHKWYCRMNPDNTSNRCDIPEEQEGEDEEPYVKTIKRQNREEKKQKRLEEQNKRQKLEMKELELARIEAEQKAQQKQAKPPVPPLPDETIEQSQQNAVMRIEKSFSGRSPVKQRLNFEAQTGSTTNPPAKRQKTGEDNEGKRIETNMEREIVNGASISTSLNSGANTETSEEGGDEEHISPIMETSEEDNGVRSEVQYKSQQHDSVENKVMDDVILKALKSFPEKYDDEQVQNLHHKMDLKNKILEETQRRLAETEMRLKKFKTDVIKFLKSINPEFIADENDIEEALHEMLKTDPTSS